MAVSSHHADRYIPWLLEVVEAEQRLDEVGWSLTPSVTPAENGVNLMWLLLISTPSPLLGQAPLTMPMFIADFYPNEVPFKECVVEALNALSGMRQAILAGG